MIWRRRSGSGETKFRNRNADSIQKEESIDRKLENIEKKEESIINKEKSITNKQQEMDKAA